MRSTQEAQYSLHHLSKTWWATPLLTEPEWLHSRAVANLKQAGLDVQRRGNVVSVWIFATLADDTIE